MCDAIAERVDKFRDFPDDGDPANRLKGKRVRTLLDKWISDAKKRKAQREARAKRSGAHDAPDEPPALDVLLLELADNRETHRDEVSKPGRKKAPRTEAEARKEAPARAGAERTKQERLEILKHVGRKDGGSAGGDRGGMGRRAGGGGDGGGGDGEGVLRATVLVVAEAQVPVPCGRAPVHARRLTRETLSRTFVTSQFRDAIRHS